jgi:hypothetical protein
MGCMRSLLVGSGEWAACLGAGLRWRESLFIMRSSPQDRLLLRVCPPHSIGLLPRTPSGLTPHIDADLRYGCRTYGSVVESAEEGMTNLKAGTAPADGRVLLTPMRRNPPPVDSFAERIESSVISRLEADVPLGVFLSGGLDSALITAIAHKHRPDLRAFTVRMPEKGYDESEEASETARAIGVRHTVLECEANPAEDLVWLIEQLGLPFGDSSLLPTYWVSRAARGHIKVALSGGRGG